MGLKIETWNIAYRKKRQGLLINDLSEFKIIKNGHKGWYADPFIFDYMGKTFLFAEYFSYELKRGVLVYSVYNDKSDSFDSFKEIIREDYHLSFPYVFLGNDGNIYMLPESCYSNQLYLYIAESFPDKWKKYKILKDNISLVDTTLFEYNNKNYAFSLKMDNELNPDKFVLFELSPDDYSIVNQKNRPADMSVDRSGGKVFYCNNDCYFVSQDCSDSYGCALNFRLFDIDENNNVSFTQIKRLIPEEIKCNYKKASGIHTYNFGSSVEVIDLKYYRKSYYRIIKKLISKIFNKF